MTTYDADVIVIGAGLAGLAAVAELVDAGRKVILLDQEPEQSIGGQAHWSFGGLFFVDSPEQRRLRIKDSHALALQDWMGTAGFDRAEDHWPRKWAEAYVDFAAGEKRSWLHRQGVRFFPVVGWAERGGYDANGHGNSVPRFHITWGTGPGLVAPFERRVREGVARGLVELRFRHRVTGLSRSAGAVDTVSGEILEPSSIERGQGSSRTVTGSFELTAQAVIVTSGGIGGNHDLVRANWPERLGTPPEKMLSGVPAHVDGLMLGITENAGAHLINRDRMWHYTEGIENWNPIWDKHGIRILPGPSSLWLDARGERLPVPLFPGFDTLGTLDHIMKTGYGYTWFVLNQRIIGKEFTLSGSEQNPDLTGKSVRGVIDRARADVPAPVKAFMDHGADFVIEKDLPALVRGMNALAEKSSGPLIDEAALRSTLVARDREIANPFTKDLQVTAIRGTRKFLGDRLIRTAAPHRILDPKAGPLVAVRLNILTRKSLGGLETDLSSRVLTEGGEPLPGVYAAGEAAGFGGGGVHGYRSLEGTFLGGCLFSGRTAGRAAAAATG
ncbi:MULTISPECIES: FAD-binding dehydrogenase [unclassified Streptomyces]|uniref:FAD-binding dehydrogenase n=1 Tax=unclassified Streptomyces TaxID=2593676 RepID=UPI002257BCB7|nr:MULTISPECIES: FAD-binding dehydrogenase [unclassified Streptomyces]MCX5436294.1 FAD-binding dehydrogenase [Streptomyces sp. NBC_00063]WUB97006.1 FAD-binding dehydrogenase [Streptomyces sp. NBC_00569]